MLFNGDFVTYKRFFRSEEHWKTHIKYYRETEKIMNYLCKKFFNKIKKTTNNHLVFLIGILPLFIKTAWIKTAQIMETKLLSVHGVI